MDSLAEVQAAINDLERQQKRLINKIRYAEQVAEDMTSRAKRLRVQVDEVQDSMHALIVKERELKEQSR